MSRTETVEECLRRASELERKAAHATDLGARRDWLWTARLWLVAATLGGSAPVSRTTSPSAN